MPTTETPHYEAETCHTGGHLCGHRHRTRQAAERCLPKLPRQSSGSLTTYFSKEVADAKGNNADREPPQIGPHLCQR